MPSTPPRIVSLQPHTFAEGTFAAGAAGASVKGPSADAVPVAGGAVQAIQVAVTQPAAQTLHLRYVLHANLSRLRIPSLKTSAQTDELWKHTCFEAFLRSRDGTAYHELNAAPSTEWALYSFADYRTGMARVNVAEPPRILIEQSAHRLTIDVQLSLKVLPASRAIALAAVIEDDGGSLSYWALKHPAGRPDFHHADGFALEL